MTAVGGGIVGIEVAASEYVWTGGGSDGGVSVLNFLELLGVVGKAVQMARYLLAQELVFRREMMNPQRHIVSEES